jgi:hypothetical protein
MSCANSVLPVFMTKPSPQDRRGKRPAIQIRPSNEAPETLKSQTLPTKLDSANRTVVISYNEKFAVPPHDETPAHRPWTKPADDLDLALTSQDERVLSKSLTFSYGGTKYCVKTQGPGTSMRGGKVMVHQFADGRLRFSYKERTLTCTAYGTYAMPDPAEDEKTLDVRVAAIIAAQRTSQGAAGLAAS